MKIERSSITTGSDGFRYKIEVFVEDHADTNKYPEGVKAIFKMIRLDVGKENETELVVLIDNHNFRHPLHIVDWKVAWDIFQTKCQEILR